MTTPAGPAAPASESTCCGEGGSWASKAGQPQVVGCMLCPNAGRRYWRNNRADGQPYRGVEPLRDDDQS
jgi:hypothetical protein